MTTNIILNQREIDTLERASKILLKYSKIIIISGRVETETDTAGIAHAYIDAIIKEQNSLNL